MQIKNIFILICHLLREDCKFQYVVFYAPTTKSRGGGILIYPLFVRPDIDTWFVWLTPTVLELQL
jgi:hypothetical protein